ncbi:MAG: peptide deformylase [Planctomycetaceae bacterium]|jgi:peptide deformylase|nr:peptide deformylase [Planctomycetaceae bacterium]
MTTPAPTLTDAEKRLSIIVHPHPTLRYKSKPILRVDDQLRDYISQMFELMYSSKGVGLAANQVNLPLQLFVVNPSGKQGEGEEMVFINPVLSRPKGTESGEEGCLSLPGVFGEVVRAAEIDVEAFTHLGQRINLRANGYLARILQHEYDHLQGVMFFDRMSEAKRLEINDEIGEFEDDYQVQSSLGNIVSEDHWQAWIQKIESRYCIK